MNPSTYEKTVIDSLRRRLKLAKKKRHDYATSEDVLANFKRLGVAVKDLKLHLLWEKKPALAYALFMVVMKLDRMNNLFNQNKTPTNEAVQDSWDDAKNYLDLAEAIYLEDRDKAIILHAHPARPGAVEKTAGTGLRNVYKPRKQRKK